MVRPQRPHSFRRPKKELTPQEVEIAAEKGKPFINYPHLHRQVWAREFFRAQAKHSDSKFKGDYTQIPRGRVARTIDKFIVLVGHWAEPIIDELSELIEKEFALPYFEYVYDEHWDLGHGWSGDMPTSRLARCVKNTIGIKHRHEKQIIPLKNPLSHIHVVLITSGLGNQMFCYAYYLALKKRLKGCLLLFDSDCHIYGHYGLEIFNVLHCRGEWRWFLFRVLKKTIPHFLDQFVTIKQKNALVFEPLPLSAFEQSTYHVGYHQSEKYFETVIKQVQRQFRFKRRRLNKETLLLAMDLVSCNSISVHIRRGDYLEQFADNMCSLDYYKKAFDYINSKVTNPQYYFFSDDMEWCRNTFGSQNNYHFVNYNKGIDSWQDMYLISKCKHNVIANSSFSWWGAWLNDNEKKIVIAPNPWFRTWNSESSYDIIPDSWIKIDNR